MMTALVLSMAVAAPVPAPAPPAPEGPLPKVMEFKPNADGKITVAAMRTEAQKVTVTTVGPNGMLQTEVRDVQVPKYVVVELSDVKDLKVTTVDGKKVEVADAVKQLKGGALVVVSADGKPISPKYLKAFRDEVLVFASPELAGATPLPGKLPNRPVPLPAPIAAPGIQIQVAPALPAVPPPVAPPAPNK